MAKASQIGDMKKCALGQTIKEIENYCFSSFKDFDEVEQCKVINLFQNPE